MNFYKYKIIFELFYGPLSSYFFQRAQQYDSWKSRQSNDKHLLKNSFFQLSHRIKNIHRSKSYQ